jgi:uncharacterized protein (DUF1330 family)
LAFGVWRLAFGVWKLSKQMKSQLISHSTLNKTMPTYIFVNVSIHDPAKFRAYAEANAALVAKLGGKYLVLGSEGIALEGAALIGKKVISEWPSRDAALAYWHSAEYAEIRKLREGICDAQVMMLDGIVPPHITN